MKKINTVSSFFYQINCADNESLPFYTLSNDGFKNYIYIKFGLPNLILINQLVAKLTNS